jgi:hypothetical protein
MFDYGMAVKVVSTNDVGEIVGIRKIENESELINCKANGCGLEIGVFIYLVEFSDGHSVEYTADEIVAN